MKKIIKNWMIFLAVGAFFVALPGCSDDGDTATLPTVSMPELGSMAPVTVSCDDVLAKVGHTFTIKLDQPATSYMICDMKVDESLVEAYNAANGTQYEVLPTNIYKLSKKVAIIKAGDTESNELAVDFQGTLFGVKKGTKYLLPLVGALDETLADGFQASQLVHYICIDVDRELLYTPGLSMRTYSAGMYRTLNLPNNEVVPLDANTHTFEMRIYPYSWRSGLSYIGTWRGNDLNNNNEGFGGCELRVTGAAAEGGYDGASNIGNRQCDLTLANQKKLIPSGKWQTLTITCDGAMTGQRTEIAYRYYLDGELIAEAVPTKRFGPASSQRFQVGYSLTGIQLGNSSSNYFDGLIGEIRMWKKCLTQEQIKANLKIVAAPSKDEMYGYWKVAEAEGTVLKDYSGNNRDLSFPENTVVVWGAEVE